MKARVKERKDRGYLNQDILRLKCVTDLLMTPLSKWYRGNISSRFTSNSEAFVSELQENIDEIFLVV